jgi:glucan phosphoethanolaminetransferase (alkaline phosphatase superfamily)
MGCPEVLSPLGRVLSILLFGAAGLMWSRRGEPTTAVVGALSAVACAAAIGWPARRFSANVRRFVASLAVVLLLSCAIAQLFERPSAPAALLDGARLALGLVVTCSVLGGGRARLVAFALVTGALASIHAALLPHLGTDGRLEADAARAIAQTNLREALDYLRFSLRWDRGAVAAASLWMLAVNVGFGVAVGIGARDAKSLGVLAARARPVVLVAAVLLGAPGMLDLIALSRPARFADNLAYAISEYRAELATFRRLRDARLPTPDSIQKIGELTDGVRSIVVIIGESTTRHHWSLYGYPRPTNAPLAGWAQQLLLYGDVVSPHSHTAPVLGQVLAGAADPARPATGEVADVVSIARAAGYDVSWLSTQNEYGIWDNVARLIAERAQHRLFLDASVSTRVTRYARDEELIPALEQVLLDRSHPRRISFVHMMGGHSPYCSMFNPGWVRIPRLTEGEARTVYGRSGGDVSVIDCYDKAMEYESAVLDKLLGVARRHGVDTVLYFPDHGESPGTGTGHDSAHHLAEHVEIPLFWYLDERFWAKHPGAVAALHGNRDKPVLSSDLFFTIQDLMGAGCRAFVPEHSLLREHYVSSPRQLFGGRFDYDHFSVLGDDSERIRANVRDLARRSPALYRRVWAHRVDTLGKLQQAMELFTGVELDVTPEDGKLFVYHPPAPNLGIELRTYLQVAARRPDLRFWLDMKLPEAVPDALVARALGDLDREFGLRSRSIVELPPDYSRGGLAKDLSSRGWRVSRYVPTDVLLDLSRHPDSREAAEFLRREGEYLSNGFACVSYDVGGRSLVAAMMKDVRARGLERLTWDLSWDPARPDFMARAEDAGESVILVPFHTRYEN